MSITANANKVLELVGESLPVFLGPAEKLPTRDGSVSQCAVVWFSTGTERTRADATARHDRLESFRVVAVGKNQLECLAAVEKVRKALNGKTLNPGDGRIFETGFTDVEPTPEPGTDPLRVIASLSYKTATKAG